MARQELGGDASIVVVATRCPSLLKQSTSFTGRAFDSHTGGAKCDNRVGRVQAHEIKLVAP